MASQNISGETYGKESGRDLIGKSSNLEHQLEKFSKEAGEKVGNIASDIADSANALADRASGYVKAGREYVRDNPAKGVAIAAAAGAVAGTLFVAMMRRRH